MLLYVSINLKSLLNIFLSLLINSVIRTETPSTVIVVVVCVDDEFDDVDEDDDIDESHESLIFFLNVKIYLKIKIISIILMIYLLSSLYIVVFISFIVCGLKFLIFIVERSLIFISRC